MKAILLCGGYGTRLQPITHYLNKHLYPITLRDRAVPIVELAIRQLKNLGCNDVAVVLGDLRAEDIMTFFHKYISPTYNMRFRYFYQGEPLGIAHGVSVAKEFVEDEEGFIVYLGDNCFIGGGIEIRPTHCLCSITFFNVEDSTRYGSPQFSDLDNMVLEKIIEKPRQPKTTLALTGLYYFNTKFYFEAYKDLEPSARGEYELTDIINIALKNCPQLVSWSIYNGFWIDAGTFEGIYKLTKKLEELE